MDLRAERTKRSIINAFIELRSRKPLEKITIKELSELAYINKATFYLHYHDIYDLSEQLENEAIAAVLKSIPHPDGLINNPKQAVYELTFALQSQNKLFNILFSGNRSSVLLEKLEAGIKESIYVQYPHYKDQLNWEILLTIMIHGPFYAFMSHSTGTNMDQVLQIIGNIEESILSNFPYQNK